MYLPSIKRIKNLKNKLKKCDKKVGANEMKKIESEIKTSDETNNRNVSLTNGNGKQKLDYEKNVLNDAKMLYVLYASDWGEKEQLANQHKLSFPKCLSLKVINVEDSEHLGLLDKECNEMMSANNPLAAVICIVLSGKMATLINSDISGGPICLKNHKDNNCLATFALYDEGNEINMFRVKYKLTNCTFIETNNRDILQDIVDYSIQINNETLCQYHINKCCYQTNESNSTKAAFKVFPKTISEGNGKVLVSFFEKINNGQHQIDVVINGKSLFSRLLLKWRNDYTVCFIVPDEIIECNTLLNISLVINCCRYLGTKQIKCHKAQIDPAKLFQTWNSKENLCQLFGVGTMHQLDDQLSRVSLGKASSDANLFNYMLQSSKIDMWLPTWIHFAAVYGLKQFMSELLKSPTAIHACLVQNSENLTPIEVAARYDHQEVVEILQTFLKQVKCIQKDLIESRNEKIPKRCLFGKENLCVSDDWEYSSEDESYYNLCQLSQTNVRPSKSVLAPAQCPSLIYGPVSGYAPTDAAVRNEIITEAKNKLLCLIDQFKSGISIESFEQLFRQWQITYDVVLKDQMSDEFLYSLNEIKKLCNLGRNLSDDELDEQKPKVIDPTAASDNSFIHSLPPPLPPPTCPLSSLGVWNNDQNGTHWHHCSPQHYYEKLDRSCCDERFANSMPPSINLHRLDNSHPSLFGNDNFTLEKCIQHHFEYDNSRMAQQSNKNRKMSEQQLMTFDLVKLNTNHERTIKEHADRSTLSSSSKGKQLQVSMSCLVDNNWSHNESVGTLEMSNNNKGTNCTIPCRMPDTPFWDNKWNKTGRPPMPLPRIPKCAQSINVSLDSKSKHQHYTIGNVDSACYLENDVYNTQHSQRVNMASDKKRIFPQTTQSSDYYLIPNSVPVKVGMLQSLPKEQLPVPSKQH